jgi:hypothetical protein
VPRNPKSGPVTAPPTIHTGLYGLVTRLKKHPRNSSSGMVSIGLQVIAKYPSSPATVTTRPITMARRGRSCVMPAMNGKRNHGAASWLTAAAHSPRNLVRLPRY